ncbi:MAG: hypothetical protein WDO68_24835 [Gammaproteobacteria bacterium]
MPRTLINLIAYDAEPMLGEVRSEPQRRSWLPVPTAPPLDTAIWQTRAAHGISWHRAGTAIARSRARWVS